jgi:ABC-type lipoprotein export system ATPase subunit
MKSAKSLPHHEKTKVRFLRGNGAGSFFAGFSYSACARIVIMYTNYEPAADPKLERQLRAVLAAFDGDVERAAEALAAVQRQQQEKQTAGRAYGPVIVQLDRVSRQYRLGRSNKVAAVQEASLEIRQGELVAITGPSGSGKSTLLNLIGGLDKPDSGTVTVDGHDLARLSDPRLSEFRNRTIGFVFQFFYLQPFLNLRTNLMVPAMFSHLSRAEREARVTELAEAVGIADRLNHLPKELSGGQMQRAAIARALLNRPKVILADEPTGNVDRANAHAILELFAKLRDTYGTTIIIVTHDAEAARRTDRTLAVRDGRVV